MRPLEFGWYLPTHGDTTAYGLMDAQIPGSPELCDRVVRGAENAGFEYLLIPVGSTCWEAWISGAFMAARSSKIKPLIAARPGYINPVLLAKMISTFDQMSGGRICINLIAGQNESEVEGEGVRYAKEERYALMAEEVSILKALWTTRGPVNFEGRFHTLSVAHIRPRPLQQPFPKFYLGGGSRQAWEMSAKHSDVHLFWGDLPERIAANIVEIRELASSLPASTATSCCRICGPASPGCGRAPASPWSAIPRNAPAPCSNSSMPAATRSACPAMCTTRRPSASDGWFARSSPRIIAAGWRREVAAATASATPIRSDLRRPRDEVCRSSPRISLIVVSSPGCPGGPDLSLVFRNGEVRLIELVAGLAVKMKETAVQSVPTGSYDSTLGEDMPNRMFLCVIGIRRSGA